MPRAMRPMSRIQPASCVAECTGVEADALGTGLHDLFNRLRRSELVGLAVNDLTETKAGLGVRAFAHRNPTQSHKASP
jgi:hypothetical protein